MGVGPTPAGSIPTEARSPAYWPHLLSWVTLLVTTTVVEKMGACIHLGSY